MWTLVIRRVIGNHRCYVLNSRRVNETCCAPDRAGYGVHTAVEVQYLGKGSVGNAEFWYRRVLLWHQKCLGSLTFSVTHTRMESRHPRRLNIAADVASIGATVCAHIFQFGEY